MDAIQLRPNFKRVAFIGNYLPRQCGIATFTSDLCESFSAQFPEVETLVVAMNDTPEGYAYPEQVRYEIQQEDLAAYERAAKFLNQHMVDAISVQHEYGIYGGPAGSHILNLLRTVSAPVVTTLHTILEKPDPDQFLVLREVAQLSNRLVVMSQRSLKLLEEVYGVPREKIDLIPHGIHDVPFIDPGFYKDKFNAEGKAVLLTFGLLSRNKGIENVIEALPMVLERQPNLLYVVLGATHPHVLAHEGEAYREGLLKRAQELGVADNVLFHNQFVDLKELVEYIGAADIYITPYLNREQVVSGTLAYTVGAGKAVISTPYWHAEELLAEGRGVVVPFDDPKATAEKIVELLENEAERSAMRKRAYLYGRDMIWPNIAQRYLDSFAQARLENMTDFYAIPVSGFAEAELDARAALNLDHLARMTDGTGMLQHAVYSVPNFNEGYTTDDNARALIATVEIERLKPLLMQAGEEQTQTRAAELSYRYMAFLWHAFNPESGRFRNFMAFDRRWLEEVGSEDSHGRALWALGTVLGRSKREGLQGAAARLFSAALPAAARFVSPRAWAFTMLGTSSYMRRYPGDRAVSQLQAELAGRLVQLYQQNASADWPWFEDIVTYCNPALPQALLLHGQTAGDREAARIGLESLEWLVQIQKARQGWISPVGCLGFYPRGGEMSIYDQQPVEVYALISACLEAGRMTGHPAWYDTANRAFAWFSGRNALGLPVYDEVTGGCRDGLHIDRLNENQGAEATLSFLQAVLEMRAAEDGTPARSGGNGKMQAFAGAERATQPHPRLGS